VQYKSIHFVQQQHKAHVTTEAMMRMKDQKKAKAGLPRQQPRCGLIQRNLVLPSYKQCLTLLPITAVLGN
jgi:hypothetical protein